MTKKQKITALIMSIILVFVSVFVAPFSTNEVHAVSLTKQQAITKYYNFQDSYNKHEVPIIKAFEKQYDGSLAHQVVARAIWYMENGYMIYNFAGGYPTNGLIDCSAYTKLVYGDFGFNITGASRKYNQVGTKVPGVYSAKVGTSSSGQTLYGIKGIENLRPGDILTYWAGTASNKYISHVSIYMGVINGKPAVINTVSNRPTALGIVNNFNLWYGEKFLEARRVLPSDAWNPKAASKYTDRGPVIPSNYYLPPQKPIVMPKTTISSLTKQVQVTGGVSLNVRSGPGTNHTINGIVYNGDVLPVIGQSGNWINIRMANGTTGYIANWLVSSYSSTSLATVTGALTVNLRSGAGTNYKILTVLNNGDKVEVLSISNDWAKVKSGSTTGYMARSLLSS